MTGKSEFLTRKNKLPLAKRIFWIMGIFTVSLFQGHNAAKVIPAEENVAALESARQKKFTVFIKMIRDENILKRFPFLSYFHLAVTLPLFKFVVILDEEAVDGGIRASNF